MKQNKNNSVIAISIIVFLLGIITIYFWRQDVEYKKCWDILQKIGDEEAFSKTRCFQIIKNQLRK